MHKVIHRKNNEEISSNTQDGVLHSYHFNRNTNTSIAFIMLASCTLMKEHKTHPFEVFLGILAKLDELSRMLLDLPSR